MRHLFGQLALAEAGEACHTHWHGLAQLVRESRRSCLVLEQCLPRQIFWQLAFTILSLEDLILEVDLRLQFGNLLLKLSLGS